MILGYIFSIINYILYATGRFMKNKPAILFFCVLSLTTAAISCYFFGSMVGFYLLLIQVFFNIIAYIKSKKNFNKILNYSIYIFTQILITIASIYTFQGIPSILCYISVTIALFSVWWFNEQKMRIAGIFVCLFSFLYSLTIHNYMGTLELAIIASNIISYCVYNKKKLAVCNQEEYA